MLKKSRRVERSQFKGLTRPYKSVTGSFFVMRLFSAALGGPSRFAVSVSKKQEKSAVKRNRIRRIAYGAIESKIAHISKGVVVHFILQKKILEPKRDITNDIISLLSNA